MYVCVCVFEGVCVHVCVFMRACEGGCVNAKWKFLLVHIRLMALGMGEHSKMDYLLLCAQAFSLIHQF